MIGRLIGAWLGASSRTRWIIGVAVGAVLLLALLGAWKVVAGLLGIFGLGSAGKRAVLLARKRAAASEVHMDAARAAIRKAAEERARIEADRLRLADKIAKAEDQLDAMTDQGLADELNRDP